MSSEFVVSRMERGVAIYHQPLNALRRTLFCTDGFKASHDVIYNILKVLSTAKWRWLDDVATVRSTAATFNQKGHLAELLVFATPEEIRSQASKATQMHRNLLLGGWGS